MQYNFIPTTDVYIKKKKNEALRNFIPNVGIFYAQILI